MPRQIMINPQIICDMFIILGNYIQVGTSYFFILSPPM